MRKNKLQKTAQNRVFSRLTKRTAVGALSLAMAGMMILPLTGCENTGKPGTTETSSENAGGKTEEKKTDPAGSPTEDTKENTSDSAEESKTEPETNSESETAPLETSEPTPEPTQVPTPEPTPEPTPVPITFTDDMALVYALKDVNIRKEPSTASSDLVVGVLAEGEMIQRTGISEEWTRVSMEGIDYYIKSEFLTTEKPAKEEYPTYPPTPTAGAGEPTQAPTVTPAGGEGGTVTNGYTTYTASTNGYTVCIDPGHQAYGMPEKEPNGPGSTEMKAKLTTGTAGVATGLAEHELNLKVALKVKQELVARGYGVVMIRETADCPVSNMERALVSNASGANVYVRIHGNSIADPNISGTTAFAPSPSNPYVGSLSGDSVRLSANIVDSMCALTGFRNRSVSYSDTMTGTNWSTIPVTIVEMGFMSNPAEDTAMATEEYQNLMARGIADGIDRYFGR